MAAPWGAIIGALTRRDDKRTEKSPKWYEAVADDNRTLEWQRAKLSGELGRVADAKAAGIHPLFALGSAGYQPQSTVTSQPQPATGGGAAIGRSLERWQQRKQTNQRLAATDQADAEFRLSQIRRMDAQSALDEQEFARLNSDNATTLQDAWSRNEGIPQNLPDEVTTHRQTGRELSARPLTEESRRSAPMRMEVLLDDGTKLRVVGKNWDEVSQADLIYQIAVHYASQGMTKVAAWAKARREAGHPKHRRAHKMSSQINAIKRLRGRPKGPWNQGVWK